MNAAREQFYKTTEQYFQANHESNFQSESRKPGSEIKKFYIKEGPFINTNKVDYR